MRINPQAAPWKPLFRATHVATARVRVPSELWARCLAPQAGLDRSNTSARAVLRYAGSFRPHVEAV